MASGLPPSALVIEGGTLIDGNGGAPVPNAVVVVQGSRITAVGRVGQVTVPPGARVINARGKFVLPGLWDSQVAYSWYFGEAMLNHGITSSIDVGTEAETAVPHRDSVLHGKVLAPLVNTGKMIKPGSWLVEGIGEDFLPPNADLSLVRKAYSISDQESFSAARDLLRRFPSRADANEALALVLVNVGKMGDAFKFAEAAVRLDPTNTNYIINMGRLYLEAELIEEASPLLEKAYAMNPKLFQAPLALGEFYSATGNGRRAVAYLRQALAACPPQMRHMIEMKLAEDLSALGQNDEAQAIYQGLQGHPTLRQRALSRAVNLKKFGIESEYFRQLNHEIAKGPQSTDTEVDLRLALGHVFENSGRYDEAFEQYRLSKAEAVGQYPIEEFKGVVSDLIEMFQAQEMESFANFGDPSELPVFVVGLPRSGTTMTEQIIAAHPEGGGNVQIMSGRYGPYVKFGKVNATLPKDKDPEQLTVDEAVALIAEREGISTKKFPVPVKEILLQPGDLIGYTQGTPASNFDFAIGVDEQSVCPWEQFAEPLRTELLAKLGPPPDSPDAGPVEGWACSGYEGKM